MSKKPKETEVIDAANSAKLLPSLSVEQEKAQRSFNVVPSGQIITLMQDVLKAGDRDTLYLMQSRRANVTHGEEIQFGEKDNGQIRITKKTQNAEISLTFNNIAVILGDKKTNKAAKKMMIFIFQEINEQGAVTRDGRLIKDVLEFPISKIVECGMYADAKGARRGFDSAIDGLKGDIQGDVTIGKSKVNMTSVTLFPTLSRIDGNCVVRLNPDAPWGAIMPFYTIIPTYLYRLGSRGFDLLLYICRIARQRIDDIESKGWFSISLRAIQDAMCLPDETKTKNPKEYIKEPIRNAVDEIMRENEHAKNKGNFSISIIPEDIDSKRITEYLNEGQLKIEMQGSYYDYFSEISRAKANIVEEKQRRYNYFVEQAQIRRLTNELKEDPKNNT